MYLKCLDICGFKTFAAKTEVEFTPGFMGVVGPNGSGKSNLTDAIRYCLGEQSTKVLRAVRQEELIFAGTPQRKSAPFCSVTATFDNSDGTFPLDFPEVAITRRTTRDGDSQYYINRTSCRQRDIHELLMGSGIGPGSFSVLGGKEINNVLSSDPHERRIMLEETAGTNRYRFRKKEALRKLGQTKDNLVRLNDILVEVDKNVVESEKALERYRRYKSAQDELKSLELSLAWLEMNELHEKVDVSRLQTAEARENSLRADAQEQALTENLTRLELAHQQTVAAMEALNSELMAHNSELAAAKASFDGVFDQDSQLAITAEAAKQRVANAAQRLQERQAELQEVQAGLPEMERLLQESKSRLQDCRRALDECPGTSLSDMTAARNRIVNLENKLRKLESQKAGQQARAEQDSTRLTSIRQEIERIAAEMPTVEDKSSAIDEVQEQIEESESRQQKLAQRRSAIKQEFAQLRQKSDQAEQLRLQYHRKVQEYEGSVNQRFGMPEAQRIILSWNDDDVYGAVAELITVRKGLETAMEAALGGKMFDIVTTDREATSRLIERMKRERLGRVTFWPLDNVQRNDRRNDCPRVNGWVGWAIDLLDFSPELRPVLQQLIGGTVVMQDLNSAYQLFAKCSGYRPNVVTMDGEFLSPKGSVTGGTLKVDRSGLLKRKRLLEDNIVLRNKQEEILRETAKQQTELQSEYRQIESEWEKASLDNREAKRLLADLQAEDRRLQRDREQVENSIKRLEREQIEINQRAENATSEAQSVEASLQALEQELREAQVHMEQVQERENKRTLERERLRQAVNEAEMRNNDCLRDMQEKRREVENLRGRQREIEEDGASARQELDRTVKSREVLRQRATELKAHIVELESGLEGQQGQLAELKKVSAAGNQQIAEAREQREAAAKEARACGERYNSLNSRLEGLEKDLAEVQTRLEECHGGTETPDLEGFDVEKSQAQARRLKNFLANFGSVNMGALDDYERLTARQTELRTNIADLESASESLENIIKEMDTASTTRFKATFEAVNQTFGRIFKEIFQGGWGRLELTDPEDILESGVDIIACPPGKKLQNLMLFSSGERTLAASAFLLALLTHKPSPIVVFDELDAPLDDSNVEKIAKRIRDFSKSSQFLVITHNRKTMEYADRLYGVTMEEPGVSRMLSVELRDIPCDNLTGEDSLAGKIGPYQNAVQISNN